MNAAYRTRTVLVLAGDLAWDLVMKAPLEVPETTQFCVSELLRQRRQNWRPGARQEDRADIVRLIGSLLYAPAQVGRVCLLIDLSPAELRLLAGHYHGPIHLLCVGKTDQHWGAAHPPFVARDTEEALYSVRTAAGLAAVELGDYFQPIRVPEGAL